jgi:hypothetical protein
VVKYSFGYWWLDIGRIGIEKRIQGKSRLGYGVVTMTSPRMAA